MPRKSKVEVSAAIDAICIFGNELKDGKLPAYTDDFYTKVAQALENKWNRHNVYINLKENRRELQTKVFEILGIENILKKESPTISNSSDANSFSGDNEKTDKSGHSNYSSQFSAPLLDGEEIFDLIIHQKLWKEMQPVLKNYNGREDLVLAPGVWTDIIADEFWKQYRMPCAFSFKKHFISKSEDGNNAYLTIIGKCKSKKCSNRFVAVAKERPIGESDLWLQVKCVDTRLKDHDEVKRQLRFRKREEIGKMVLKDGAANTRRKIAAEMQNIGDIPAPILYKNEVLRKVLQELKDKELNVDPKEGTDPLTIFLMLQNRTPYCGSIRHISASKFQVQYLLQQQIFVYKEYSRLYADRATISIDSTGSLVKKIDLPDGIKSPTIFLYEIVINFSNITLSVGQMLSAAQDTISISYWLLNWVKLIKTVPKEAVSDYSKALLGAMMLSFNTMTLKEYIQICFELLTNNEMNRKRVIKTYIRVDVAHLIQICCRLKCFAKCNKAVKDFYIRCVALMVSCEDFNQFQDILLCTIILTLHHYDGNLVNNIKESPAKSARLKLLKCMSIEEHRAFKLIPQEDSEDFQKSFKKLLASGFDPNDPHCFINQEVDADVNILKWLEDLKKKAEIGIHEKYEEANAYYMPQFFKHIFNLAKEFPLWTAVNRKHFNSPYVRPSSSCVEGAFGELKNNILNNVHGAIRSDKFFKIDFEASKAQCLIAAAEIAKIQMQNSLVDVVLDNKQRETTEQITNLKKDTKTTLMDDLLSFDENCMIPKHESTRLDLEAEIQTDLPNFSEIINIDLFAFENWKNKATEEIPILNSQIVVADTKTKNILQQKQSENSMLKTVEEIPTSNSQLVITDTKAINILQQKQSEKPMLKTTEKIQSELPKKSCVIDKNLKISKIIEQKICKKRKLQFTERKPSKFFKKCPNILTTQDAAIAAAKVNIKDPLLLNGNKFSQPIKINGQMFMLTNSCPFDSIAQILLTLTIDSPKYLLHVEESTNETLGFILVFLEHGAVNHVYGLRCLLLKDFNKNSRCENKSLLKLKDSPYMLQTVDTYCNVTEMWEFLMISEPSLYITLVYPCGNCKVEGEIPSIFVNHKIIETEGFQNLQNAIITQLESNLVLCNRDKCGFSISTKIIVNRHLFIELDIRETKNIKKSLTCKVEDLPLHINLHGEKLRFVFTLFK